MRWCARCATRCSAAASSNSQQGERLPRDHLFLVGGDHERRNRAVQATDPCGIRGIGWRIEPGTVMTDEPGIYFIPALIDKCKAEGKYKGIVDYDALDAYRDFGGIRIEDDIIVTETGSRMIGGDKRIPITVDELEAVVGR